MAHVNFKKYLSYDPETGIFRWTKVRPGRGVFGAEAGTLERKGYLRIKVAGERVLAHRIAWYFIYGKFPSHQVDHINQNKSDNRAINLRRATNLQNQANRGKNKNNTSGFKGVSWRKDNRKWKASIAVNGKKMSLGHFDSAEKAAKAYEVAAKKFFGEYACT